MLELDEAKRRLIEEALQPSPAEVMRQRIIARKNQLQPQAQATIERLQIEKLELERDALKRQLHDMQSLALRERGQKEEVLQLLRNLVDVLRLLDVDFPEYEAALAFFFQQKMLNPKGDANK